MGNVASRCGMILFGVVLATLLAEGVLRLRPEPSCNWFEFVQADERFGWINVPKKVGIYCSEEKRVAEEYRVPIQINSKGLLDREIAYVKEPGAFRILVLGDSFMQGFQVLLHESFPKVLEINLRAAASERIEVINGGVDGFGTDNELLFFRHEGVKYAPDLTILAFFVGNDPIDNSRELGPLRPYMVYLPKPYLVRDGEGWIFTPYPAGVTNYERAGVVEYGKELLRRRSKVYPLIRSVVLGRLSGPTMEKLASWGIVSQESVALRTAVEAVTTLRPEFLVFAKEYAPSVREALEVTKELLTRLRDEVEAHNGKLFVVLIPQRFQFDPLKWQEALNGWPAMKQMEWDLQKPNRLLTSFFDAKGIPHLDLLPHFRAKKERTGSTGYFYVDGHWTKDGNQFAAQVVGDELMRLGLVPVE